MGNWLNSIKFSISIAITHPYAHVDKNTSGESWGCWLNEKVLRPQIMTGPKWGTWRRRKQPLRMAASAELAEQIVVIRFRLAAIVEIPSSNPNALVGGVADQLVIVKWSPSGIVLLRLLEAKWTASIPESLSLWSLCKTSGTAEW